MRKVEIFNNGASLKLIMDGVTRNILKNQIREITVINETVIKIDIGMGTLNNIFFDFAEVTNPIGKDAADLVEIINTMMLNSYAGISTEKNQEAEISELRDIKTSLLFQKAAISDETNPRTIYKGYAPAGALTSDPVWSIEKVTNDRGIYSIQWAGGNREFNKVWDDRKGLIFS